MRDTDKDKEALLRELAASRHRIADLEAKEQERSEAQKKIEEELLNSRKYESISSLVGGFAHDFNNLLNFTLGNLYLCRKFAEQGTDLYERLAEAEKAALMAKDLTYQLLILAKVREPVRRVTQIEKLIRNSVHLALMGSRVSCVFSIAGDLYPVEINEGQVAQVIHNLLINAMEAMSSQGIVQISAQNISLEAPAPPVKTGSYVRISVQDEGVGIPEEHLSRIFDPYFTTKERGTQKGTGLGLAICFAVIKNHRGYITVDSQAGKGSTFHIYLPASSKEGLPQKERGEEKPLRGRILVMDDEEIDREVIGEMLRRISFSAEFASDGEETVELYRKAGSGGEPFDALIMDLVIPGRMGGKEAINKLLEIDPEVKAIVTSGYSNDPILMDFRSYGFSGVLPKPFNVDELNQVLNRVLFR